jgi:hypothetical protein
VRPVARTSAAGAATAAEVCNIMAWPLTGGFGDYT